MDGIWNLVNVFRLVLSENLKALTGLPSRPKVLFPHNLLQIFSTTFLITAILLRNSTSSSHKSLMTGTIPPFLRKQPLDEDKLSAWDGLWLLIETIATVLKPTLTPL